MPASRVAIHPGKVLADELAELGVAPKELAARLQMPVDRIAQIIRGKRSITGDTALRLGHWFKTTPEFWMNLQIAHDIRSAQDAAGDAIRRLPTRVRQVKSEPR